MLSYSKMNLIGSILMSTALVATTAMAAPKVEMKDPYNKDNYQNNSMITIQGTVVSTHPGGFDLRYDKNALEKGIIIVELDDWDSFDEAQYVDVGEYVTVYGKIDQDMYEKRSIEADGVYSHDDNNYYFASKLDEEDFLTSYYYIPAKVDLKNLKDGDPINVRGVVGDVDSDDFELKVGTKTLNVEIDNLAYNPLDKKGYQRLQEGDLVYVSGNLDKGLLSNEIEADTILTLYKSLDTQS